MYEENNFFEAVENDINNSSIPEQEKIRLLKKVHKYKDKKINLMITGSTGSGKSSTINALFGTEQARVGQGADPETMEIARYELNNLVIWDSPGLGDSKEKDNTHAKKIIKKLNELDDDGNALIDVVLVLIDGSNRDMGTSYQLINEVIIPNLGKDKSDRLLVAINKCDVAMSGRHWNFEENKPDGKLVEFMNEKVESVRNRIYESTGVRIEPIYYAAGFKEDDDEQQPYNLSKLLYYILQKTPKQKRVVYANNVSKDPDVWADNDDIKDYNEEIRTNMFGSFMEDLVTGSEYGEQIGQALFGAPGAAVGKLVGGLIGGVTSVVKGIGSLFGGLFSW